MTKDEFEAPALAADLNELAAHARRSFPLNVPDGAAATLAASGASLTQAKAKLFQMVTGDDPGLASMKLQLAQIAQPGPLQAGPSPIASTSMLAELMKARITPAGAGGKGNT